jgi:hypothetical protein
MSFVGKVCKDCGVKKPLADFESTHNRTGKYACVPRCKPCNSEHRKQYRIRKREQDKAELAKQPIAIIFPH